PKLGLGKLKNGLNMEFGLALRREIDSPK
ncbi:hypothetical protein A2U01_0109834, partial [Trifolium medium]|nr:hypothetical protein [Trifolium medium]